MRAHHKGRFSWCSALLVLVVLVGAGCAFSSHEMKTAKADKETAVVEEAMRVKTGEVIQTDVPAAQAQPQTAPAGDDSTLDEKMALPEYRIAPGDTLAFRSFDDETLNLPQVMVRFDGYISLPLIEDVAVAGLTRDEALEAVRKAYCKVFRDPQVSLTVVAATGQSFYVMGDVNRPSEYPYRRPISVLQAINVAGGVRDRSRATGEYFESAQGSLSLAYIIRHKGKEREIISCDLKGLTNPGQHPSQIPIWPDDVVFVPEGVNLVYIMGAVVRPTVFSLVEGESLLQVLARAGGVLEPVAYKQKVVIIRGVNTEESEVLLVNVKRALKTGKDVTLRGGDIVYVPRRPLVRLQDFANRFAGSFLPIMDLYQEAYNTWYTDKQFSRMFDRAGDGTAGTLAVLQGLRDFGNVFRTVTSTP